MNKLTTTALSLIVALSAQNALACGETMYHMGAALHYHTFTTQHPANILVYTGPVTGQAIRTRVSDLDKNLEKAGHKVTNVTSPDALGKALAARHYDVIITSAANLPQIDTQLANVQRDTSLIPLLQHGNDGVRQQYPLALNEDANIHQFLKTIEQTMKSRGT